MGDEFTGRPLTPETWDAFAALVERHNGIFGGCWCIAAAFTRALHERAGFSPATTSSTRGSR